jgi:hypothetical protein
MKQRLSAYKMKALSGHALGRLVVELATPKKPLSHWTVRYVVVLFSRLSGRVLGRMKHCCKPRNPDAEIQMPAVNAKDKHFHYYLQKAFGLEYYFLIIYTEFQFQIGQHRGIFNLSTVLHKC